MFDSGYSKGLVDLDQFVVDGFYHARDLLWAMNVSGEDGVFIKSRIRSGELILEDSQSFSVKLNI